MEEEFGERKTTRKLDLRQPIEQERSRCTRSDASSVSQLVQPLHQGKRTRGGLLQIN